MDYLGLSVLSNNYHVGILNVLRDVSRTLRRRFNWLSDLILLIDRMMLRVLSTSDAVLVVDGLRLYQNGLRGLLLVRESLGSQSLSLLGMF